MQSRTGRRANRCAPWLLFALAAAACVPAQADTGSLNVSAVVLSRSLCRFTTDPAILDFGTINPASPGPATAKTQVRFACLGFQGATTYVIRPGNGLNSVGAGLRRVRRGASADTMAYSLTILQPSGTINWFAGLAGQAVDIEGSIPATEYQNARPGVYSDTVVLELDP